MAILLDTWAWIEYFRGTDQRLRRRIEYQDHATSVLTLAELSDRHHRSRWRGYDARAQFIEGTSRILEVSSTAASAAGRTKWSQRKRGHRMGLADAIIYETAREHGLTVLTGDPGFEGLKGVEFLGTA